MSGILRWRSRSEETRAKSYKRLGKRGPKVGFRGRVTIAFGWRATCSQLSSCSVVRSSKDLSPMLNDLFRRIAHRSAEALGSSWAFVVAFLVVVVWGATGPLFRYSDTWQLVINTGTTIVTFLMVFLIQNAQNRDAKAIHLKLDELIHGVKGARNSLINLQDLTDEDLERLQVEFQRLKNDPSRDSVRPPFDVAAASPGDGK